MTQPELDFTSARARRDSGIAKAEASAGTWMDEAWAFLLEYARTHETVFCDELWQAGLPPTTQPKALGALFVKASKAKVLERVGYRPSKASHLAPKPLWSSRIYRGTP